MLRKGVEKIIEKLPNGGAEDTVYTAWLRETTLPLNVLQAINGYYLCCRQYQNPAAVVKEIRKYADDPIAGPVCLVAEPNQGDRLLGKAGIKRKIIQRLQNHGWYDAMVYRLTLIGRMSEKTTETVLSAYQQYQTKIMVKLENEKQKWMKKEASDDQIKKKYQAYESLFLVHMFWNSMTRFSEAEHPMEQFLWQDLEQRRELSFLYKTWAQGKVAHLFPTEKTATGGKPPFTQQQAKQYSTILYNALKDKPDWEDRLLQTTQYTDSYDLLGSIILSCQTQSMRDIFAEFSPAYRTLTQMEEKGLVEQQSSYRGENCYIMKLYDKDAVGRFLKVSDGNQFGIATPICIMNFKATGGMVFGEINEYYRTWVFQEKVHVSAEEEGAKIEDIGELLDLPFGPAYGTVATKLMPRIEGENLRRSLSFFVTPENTVYAGIPKRGNKWNKRWVPMQMKRFVQFMEDYPQTIDFFYMLAENSKEYFVKDVLNDIREYGRKFKVPITYEEARKYHSRQEFFENKYKNAGILRWNYNRHNMGLSYMVVKSLDYVDIRDYGILQNTGDHMAKYIEEGDYERGSKEPVSRFLSGYYKDRFKLTEEENQKKQDRTEAWKYYDRERAYNFAARDYIQMSMEDHRPVVLRYSAHRVNEEHDRFNDRGDYRYYLHHSKPFTVPKNSQFNPLRKILPPEFEWIKTRKRLINESMMMHHCVWSYYGKIGNDYCAIYSYDDKTGEYDARGNHEPKRYTIEFLCKKGHYQINQIQTKYDRGGGKLLKEKLQQMLKEAEKKNG